MFIPESLRVRKIELVHVFDFREAKFLKYPADEIQEISGRGSNPARSMISGSLCSHSMAMM
jgi:hypothetical protein